jgi:acetate kinase
LATLAKTVEARREPWSLLAINGGSSSIRFALYEEVEPLRRRLVGKVDRVGMSGMTLTFMDSAGTRPDRRTINADDHQSAAAFLLDWLETQQVSASVRAVGHRLVHGMTHSEPERVTPRVLDELRRITPYDPEHLPLEIELIEAFRQRHPALPQVACFDTAFHGTMPRVASLLPIPRRYEAAGVRRYGFHGLSYEFLMEELARLGDPAATKGRVILAHLGNGASVAAVRDGKSIGTLVFAGGIAENAPLVRSRICEGLGFLGIELDETRNAATEAVISADAGRVTVRVIPTDEELMIARSVCRILKPDKL